MVEVLKQMSDLGERIGNAQTRKHSLALEHARDASEINRLVATHSLTHSELAARLDISRSKLHELVNDAIEEGVIDRVHRDSNKYYYTLEHVHKLFDYLEKPSWSDDHKECVVLAVANGKGGSGKSTTVINVAAALSLEIESRPRTLVIDLDPTGGASRFGLTPFDNESNTITAIDIALGQFEDDAYQTLKREGMLHGDILQASLIKTHIPNLHIMPSLYHDSRFESTYWSAGAKRQKEIIAALRREVIDQLRDYYDIILIDTGSRSLPLTCSAFEAANGALIPVSTRTFDLNGTGAFLLSRMSDIEALCPRAGENINWFKIAPVNVNMKDRTEKQVLNQIMKHSEINCLTNFIIHSPAFEAANERHVTVFDLLRENSYQDAKRIESAINSVQSFAREIKMSLKTVF